MEETTESDRCSTFFKVKIKNQKRKEKKTRWAFSKLKKKEK